MFQHSTVRAALSVYDATVSELLQYELEYHRHPGYTSMSWGPVTGITNNLDNITERGVCMIRGHLVGAWSFESALEMAFLKMMDVVSRHMPFDWENPQADIDEAYDVRISPPLHQGIG